MTTRSVRPDGLDTTVTALRSPSISSDVMSNSTKSFNGMVPLANPPPAYIAAAGASNLISSELDRTVVTSAQALDLVNEFLDQVLFNILATAKSVSLISLRAAVPSVLKPRLGKAAVRAAEEDLKEYLEEEEEAELNTREGTVDSKDGFDTELAWKLARLRCMVYAQLGDLEEEDEEEWLEKEQLLEQIETRRDTHADIELGPTAAIFLASVIEFLGEQALHYAAQHAQKRMNMARVLGSAESESATRTLTPKTDEIVLEGKDMNHVGRDSPLSRLWRSWRRNTRDASARAFSPDATVSSAFHSPKHSRTGSQVPGIEQITEEKRGDLIPEQSPSEIPLPLGENDINEIEVPGLAPVVSDDEDDDDYEFIEHDHRRPSSMVFMPGAFPEVESETPSSEIDAEQSPVTPLVETRPQLSRQRSMSSPAPRKMHHSLWKTYVQPMPEQLQEAKDGTEAEQLSDQDMSQVISIDQKKAGKHSADQASYSPVTPQSATSSHSRTSSTQAGRRGRASPREPGSPNKRDGMVGNAIAAAIGAAGAAGAAALLEDEHVDNTAQERESPPLPAQKRTVAEEMLGGGDAVKPPRDAATGSSITNVSDFDSMYVPMRMPTETERRSMPAAARPKPGPSHKSSASQGSMSQQAVALQRKPLPAEPEQQDQFEQPTTAPIQRSPPRPPQAGQSEHAELPGAKPSMAAIDTAIAQPIHRGPDSPVSPIPLNEQRPRTADSNVSDEDLARPVAPQDALRSNPVHEHAVSQTSAYSQHSKSSSSSSRILGFTRDATGKPQTISQQHAAGGMTDNARAAHSSTSTYANKENRPSTASSSTSRVVGKPSTPLYAPVNVPKKSEDIDADKKKSLEILIRSNETLHYTLTPANVMQNNQSITAPPKRTETQDMADFLRSTGPSNTQYNRGYGGSTPANSMEPASVRNAMVGNAADDRITPVSQNHYGSSSARARNRLGEARDPRVERDSTVRDLADYARSTGPMDESQMPKLLNPRQPLSTSSRGGLGNQAKSQVSKKPRNRIKLEARDARPSRTADNSDLIDFIREGPPRAAGDHRIDRKVAPFRTTMDSEDLNSLAPHVDQDSSAAYSAASTYDERSADPSINSQTALLTANRRPLNGAGNTYNPRSQATKQFGDDGMPQRTRRRVKDPYAIDDSDDDELFEENARAQQPSNEESLIDFLRNTAPPPGSGAQPILGARPGNTTTYTPARATAGAMGNDVPHLTQSGSKMDKYRPTQATHAAHVDRNRNKPQFEAREARPKRTDTSELAEYLKFSGPAPSAEREPQPFDIPQTRNYQQKDDSGLMRMFTKRKAK